MIRYVALEGVDGAGKSTISDRLAARLEMDGHEVVRVREPGGTVVGEEVRSLLLHGGEIASWTEALLFAAQRAELAETVIRPALERGAFVISDRSLYSSLAYQGGARGLGVEAVRTANLIGLGGTLPELVVVLDVTVDEALDRQEMGDRIGSAGRQIQEAVAATYRQLAAAEPERVRIVGTGSIDETTSAVYNLVVSG